MYTMTDVIQYFHSKLDINQQILEKFIYIYIYIYIKKEKMLNSQSSVSQSLDHQLNIGDLQL